MALRLGGRPLLAAASPTAAGTGTGTGASPWGEGLPQTPRTGGAAPAPQSGTETAAGVTPADLRTQRERTEQVKSQRKTPKETHR